MKTKEDELELRRRTKPNANSDEDICICKLCHIPISKIFSYRKEFPGIISVPRSIALHFSSRRAKVQSLKIRTLGVHIHTDQSKSEAKGKRRNELRKNCYHDLELWSPSRAQAAFGIGQQDGIGLS